MQVHTVGVRQQHLDFNPKAGLVQANLPNLIPLVDFLDPFKGI